MSLDEIERPPPGVTPKPGSRLRPEAAAPAGRARRAGSRARYRRLLRLLATLATAAALIAGGVSWWLEARQWVTTDDAFIDAHMVLIAPQAAGRVARVLAGDNERVAAGQLLVALDPAEYQAKLDQAAANRAAAAGGLAQAKAQRAALIAGEEEARAEVGVAEANAAHAASQLQRTQSLVERQFASRQQLDNDLANARGGHDNVTAAICDHL